MEREKVALFVLVGVLLVAVLLLVGGTVRSTSIDLPDDGSSSATPGRLVDRGEFSGSCLEDIPGATRITGSCIVRFASTDEPFWDVPLVGRWLPREARRIDVTLEPSECSATIVLDSGDVSYEDVDLNDEDGLEASLTLRPEGGRLRVGGFFPPTSACSVLVG